MYVSCFLRSLQDNRCLLVFSYTKKMHKHLLSTYCVPGLGGGHLISALLIKGKVILFKSKFGRNT